MVYLLIKQLATNLRNRLDYKNKMKKEARKLEDKMKTLQIKSRLESIRKSILNESVSYGEIAELQSLTKYIDPSDTLLLEWAGKEETK